MQRRRAANLIPSNAGCATSIEILDNTHYVVLTRSLSLVCELLNDDWRVFLEKRPSRYPFRTGSATDRRPHGATARIASSQLMSRCTVAGRRKAPSDGSTPWERRRKVPRPTQSCYRSVLVAGVVHPVEHGSDRPRATRVGWSGRGSSAPVWGLSYMRSRAGSACERLNRFRGQTPGRTDRLCRQLAGDCRWSFSSCLSAEARGLSERLPSAAGMGQPCALLLGSNCRRDAGWCGTDPREKVE